MPIYEFYCRDCHMVFNFFSRTVNTTIRPSCPRCPATVLERQVSMFAVTGRAKEEGDMEDLPMDEGKMEKAMQMLAGEAEKGDADDPRQAADLMRRLTDMTGIDLGEGMSEALGRLEDGEDPERIEAEMAGILENEDPFSLPGRRRGQSHRRSSPPGRDETLYDL